jgi:hypothetical protein
MTVKRNTLYRTPWEPAGTFWVTKIEPAEGLLPESACGFHMGDHPKGYQRGEFGRYLTSELDGREVTGKD